MRFAVIYGIETRQPPQLVVAPVNKAYATYWTYLVTEEADVSVHYESFTDARTHLKTLLDAARAGRLATVRRDATTSVVIDSERLRSVLASTSASAQVVAEADGWSVMIPGMPVAADGPGFDEAIDEMIEALREYAFDWNERLLDVPNHRRHWSVVALVGLSTDAQLREWLVGDAR